MFPHPSSSSALEESVRYIININYTIVCFESQGISHKTTRNNGIFLLIEKKSHILLQKINRKLFCKGDVTVVFRGFCCFFRFFGLCFCCFHRLCWFGSSCFCCGCFGSCCFRCRWLSLSRGFGLCLLGLLFCCKFLLSSALSRLLLPPVLNLLYLLPYSITSLANSIYSPALLLLFLNSTTGALLSWDHSMELSTRMKVSKR